MGSAHLHTRSTCFGFGLILALGGAALAQQNDGLPPPEAGPPGIQGRSANRVQQIGENDASRLGQELKRALRDEVFSLGDASVIPADREGRPRYHAQKGYRILSVELPYTTEPVSEETRRRMVEQGRGDLHVQHITFQGATGAASALQYATEELLSQKRAAHVKSATGIVVRGNRVLSLEDDSRLLAHPDARGRAVARERLQKFAEVAFQFAGGANEAPQAEILVLAPGEVVVTLPREFDDDLLDRGFGAALGQELSSAKVVRREGGRVSYVVAGSPARADQIADELKDGAAAAAQRARVGAQVPSTQGPATGGINRQLPPH